MESVIAIFSFYTKYLNIGFELLFSAVILTIITSKKYKKTDKIIMTSSIIFMLEMIDPTMWHRIALAAMFYFMDIKKTLKILIVMSIIALVYVTQNAILAKNGVFKENFMFYSIDLYAVLAVPIIAYFASKEEKEKPKKIYQLLKYSIYPVHLILISLYRIYFLNIV